MDWVAGHREKQRHNRPATFLPLAPGEGGRELGGPWRTRESEPRGSAIFTVEQLPRQFPSNGVEPVPLERGRAHGLPLERGRAHGPRRTGESQNSEVSFRSRLARTIQKPFHSHVYGSSPGNQSPSPSIEHPKSRRLPPYTNRA